MDEIKTVLTRGMGRRSLLQGLGVSAIGISITGLVGCSKESGGAKIASTKSRSKAVE